MAKKILREAGRGVHIGKEGRSGRKKKTVKKRGRWKLCKFSKKTRHKAVREGTAETPLARGEIAREKRGEYEYQRRRYYQLHLRSTVKDSKKKTR